MGGSPRGAGPSPSPGTHWINTILWLRCLESVRGCGEEVGAWSLWMWAEGFHRVGATVAPGGIFSLWPGLPVTKAPRRGCQACARAPCPGGDSRSSSLPGRGQTQDEVVPALLSGGLPASLSEGPASACASGEERERSMHTKAGPSGGAVGEPWAAGRELDCGGGGRRVILA